MTNEEMNDPRQTALFREIDEELRNDKLKAFWKKYRFFIIGLCVAIVVGTAIFEVYKYQEEQTRIADSNSFSDALTLASEGKLEPAIAEMQKIAEEKDTRYADLASLRLVSLLEENGKKDDALSRLYEIKSNTSFKEPIRNIATIALAQRLLDKKDFDLTEFQAMLAPLTNKDSAWCGVALELSALGFIEAKEPTKALEQLELIVGNLKVPGTIRERARSLISLIKKDL